MLEGFLQRTFWKFIPGKRFERGRAQKSPSRDGDWLNPRVSDTSAELEAWLDWLLRNLANPGVSRDTVSTLETTTDLYTVIIILEVVVL